MYVFGFMMAQRVIPRLFSDAASFQQSRRNIVTWSSG